MKPAARRDPRFRPGAVPNFYGNLPAVCADTGIARQPTAAVPWIFLAARELMP